MCGELAKQALEDLVNHVFLYDEILLITPEMEVPEVYEKLRFLLDPDDSAHLSIGARCIKVDVFDELAVTLRACKGDSPSHKEWVALIKTGARRPRNAPAGYTTRGLCHKTGEIIRDCLPCINKRKIVRHLTTDLVVDGWDGRDDLECPETEGVFLSLRFRVMRIDGLVKLEVNGFSIRNSRGCAVYLIKWDLDVSTWDQADVHEVWPCETIRKIPRIGAIFRGSHAHVGANGPFLSFRANVSVAKDDRIERGGFVQSWSTHATRGPRNAALLGWSTWLWLARREARDVLGGYEPATQYFLGERIVEGGFTVDLEGHSPGAAFKIPERLGSERMEFGRFGLEVKLKAQLRKPSKLHKAQTLVEVEKFFRITLIFEQLPDPASLSLPR